jgi:hypothetical protein
VLLFFLLLEIQECEVSEKKFQSLGILIIQIFLKRATDAWGTRNTLKKYPNTKYDLLLLQKAPLEACGYFFGCVRQYKF